MENVTIQVTRSELAMLFDALDAEREVQRNAISASWGRLPDRNAEVDDYYFEIVDLQAKLAEQLDKIPY